MELSNMHASHTSHRSRLTIGLVIAALAVPFMIGAASATAAPAATQPTGHHKVAINVIEPAVGQAVTDPTTPMYVHTSGFRFDARYAGTPLREGVGHFHTIIDGHLIDMSPSVRNGNRDTLSMVGLAPGPHVLTVVPAWNDHMEGTPAAVNVAFTYAGPYLPEPVGYTGTAAATIALIGPTAGSTIHGSSFELTADIQNFLLCGDCYGKANVTGEGHWHIFLDLPTGAMDPMSMMPHMMTMADDATQTVSLEVVTAGLHTFTAILVGNDHMPIMPMAMASIILNVTTSHHHGP